jgi:hypothetical protein
MVWLLPTVTVYDPVALLPAAKTAVSPLIQFAVEDVPAATLDQLAAPLVAQVPFAVVPLDAPAVAPLVSQ